MNSTIKENIRVVFRSDDSNYDWMSEILKQPGFEFMSCSKISNSENANWPKWTFIVDYKRNK